MIDYLLVMVVQTISYAHCHGTMVIPNNWFDSKIWILPANKSNVFDFVGMKSGLMCRPGQDIGQDKICQKSNPDKSCYQFLYPGQSCMWFTNNTRINRPTLFDAKLRTYVHSEYQETLLYHPWRAPGRAPIDSPCGVAGGNMGGCQGGCNYHRDGYAGGPRATDFHFKHQFHVSNWTRGAVVEVAWGIAANHGGGYAYRLCKLPEAGIHQLTEECFQQTYLDFVGDKQWAQYGEDESTRIEFPAVRVNTGTFPQGSTWTKNPIPACAGTLGGFEFPSGECINGFQFDPPATGLGGYGLNVAHNFPRFKFSIIDKVRIPKGLESGEYVLSFRWDCEQSAQVWNTCASVHLH